MRIPLIGGVNDDVASVEAFANYVAGLAGTSKEINLLPFHDVARGKDLKLGQVRDLSELQEPGPENVARALKIFHEYGLTASVGG